MRLPSFVIIVALFCLALAPATRAQSSDPGQIFLSAFMSSEEAEKLEAQGSFRPALAKFRYAGSIIDQLQQRNPDWQPHVIAFRKKKIADAIQRLESRIALEPPPAPITPQPGLDPSLVPGVSDSNTPTGGDAFDRAAVEMRAQMKKIKQQLERSRIELENEQKEKARIARQLEEASSKLSDATSLAQQQAEKLRRAEAVKLQIAETEAAKVEAAIAETAKAREQQEKLRKELEKAKTSGTTKGEASQPESAKVEAALAELAKAKEQQEALRKELGKAKESEAALKSQIEQADAEQSTAKSKIERNQGTLQALQAELDAAKAEAEKAKTQLSRAKNSEADLQAKLESTRKEIEAKSKEKEASALTQNEALKKQLEKLRLALDDAKADREVAEEQGELIFKRSVKIARERAEATNRNQQLSEELATAQKKAAALAETEAKLVKVTQERDVANKKVESLADVEKKLVAMVREREAARKENSEMAKELAKSKQKVETVSSERDNALAQLEQAKAAKGQVEKLLTENASLMKKLDEAQKSIAEFNSAGAKNENQITALKTQLTAVETQLATAKQEGASNRTLISELQKQLDAASKVAKAPVTEEQKRLNQENELLRGIVLRELKEQARREQSRQLILSELDRLQVRSKGLNEQIGLLSQPAVKLSDAERALFKGPQMEIIDNTPGAMSISIAAPASDNAAAPKPKNAAPGIEGALPASGNDELPAAPPKVSTKLNFPVPPELQDLAKQAKDHCNRGEYLKAERTYEKIVSKAPTNIYALSNLGVTRFRAGHLKLAEETFKKVLVLAPNDAFTHSTLGIVYFEQSRYDEAVNALTQAVAINPKSATSHNYLGIAAVKKGWLEAAQKELQTAVQLDTDYAEAHFNLAVLLSTMQPPNKESARKHYKKALDLGMKADPKVEETLR